MTEPSPPMAITADEVAPRSKPSTCPEPFAAHMKEGKRRVLDDVFGLSNFGVKLTLLGPGNCVGFKAATGDGHCLHKDGRPYP